MKKIFLSILALGLVVVACDKQDDFITPEAVVEQALEIDAAVSLDLSSVKDALNSIGFTGDFSKEADKAVYASRTNAESTPSNCIDNRPAVPAGKTAIDFQYKVINPTSGHFITRGGGDTPLLLNRPIVRFLVGSSSEDVMLQLFLFSGGAYSNAVALGTTGYSAVFPILAADGYVTIDRTDLYLDSLTDSAGVSAADAGIACAGVEYSSYYTVTPAPFPLTGFLGTIIDQSMFAGTSLNYAATTTSTLITAIEADIADGN